ncbi:MAG: PASTA domain-containing protein [Chitinophagaceae bacterium]|nr:PASTA domain-containing protein [Chitinophagaceae bacterium]
MLKRSLLFNLFLAILIVSALLFIFFGSLNWITNHGKQTTVPKLTGKTLKSATRELEKMGFKIQIDSTYQSYKKPLEVLFQEPEAGATVKVGRTIFITVNRKSVPSVPMPNLVNLSFRNAMLTLQSFRLVMGDTTYKPDVAAGAVLEQWVNGKKIAPGTQVPYGTKIDLVVGEGLSDMMDVPNLIGMSWNEAKATIESLSLTANVLWDGAITDSGFAIVYMQSPEALNELDFKNTILAGDMIDVHVMQMPTKELLEKNQPGSKKLLGESDSLIDPLTQKSADSVRLKNGDKRIGTSMKPEKGTDKLTNKPTNKDNSPVKPSDNKIGGEYE